MMTPITAITKCLDSDTTATQVTVETAITITTSYYYHVKLSPTLAGSLMSTNQNGGFLVVSESQLCVSLLSQLYPTPPPSFRFDYFFTQPSS